MSNEVNGEQGTSQSGSSDARLSRRRMLKAAVAGGVGVAAWSTPSIRSVGGTPAYAVACSTDTPTTYTEDGGGNTNCGNACNSVFSLGWLGAGNIKRNISGPGFAGSLTFTSPTPECSDIARPVIIVANRTSDGAALNCTLTGVYVEVINNSTPVPANPPGSAPRIQNGAPAPAVLIGNPYVDATDPMNPVWQGIDKNNGISNICSSQWSIEMECTLAAC